MRGTEATFAAGVPASGLKASIKTLVGAGHKIGRLALPVIVGGLALNFWQPEWFSVGGPSRELAILSIAMLVPGAVLWLWSVALILTKVPKHQLITGGPFALVKHPLYTAVSLLVLPSAGFLLNSWLGVVLGLVIYTGSRLYAPAEERDLAAAFGPKWDAYENKVLLPWL